MCICIYIYIYITCCVIIVKINSHEELERFFRDLDTDMSGTISVDEFAEALKEMFETYR